MKAKYSDLGWQLRLAMRKSGLSLYRISKDSGVNYASVHRFAHGKVDMTLDTASKVASVLGLKLKGADNGKG